eukprot:g15866.t1
MNRKTIKAALLAALFGIFISTTGGALAGQTAATIDWPAWGGTGGGGHYSASTQITAENVASLKQVWSHRSGDFYAGAQGFIDSSDAEGESRRSSTFITTPIMVNDRVYYCSSFNRVFALDPASGEEIWSFDPEVDMSKESFTSCRGVSSWQDPGASGMCSHRILLGTLDGRIFALDGATGARCKDFGDNGEIDLAAGLTEHGAHEYNITSAPAIIGDLVISGAMVIDSYRADVPAGTGMDLADMVNARR